MRLSHLLLEYNIDIGGVFTDTVDNKRHFIVMQSATISQHRGYRSYENIKEPVLAVLFKEVNLNVFAQRSNRYVVGWFYMEQGLGGRQIPNLEMLCGWYVSYDEIHARAGFQEIIEKDCVPPIIDHRFVTYNPPTQRIQNAD